MQHQDGVFSAAFSPDGRRIVTASNDHTARVWEAETGKPLGMPMQHQKMVIPASFSPDGHRIVTASQDGTARVWPGLLICCASQQEADQLATLAEAVSSNQVSDTGSLSVINGQEFLQKLNRHSRSSPVQNLSLDWIIDQFTSKKNTE